MSEWLRSVTRNHIGSACAGSSPAAVSHALPIELAGQMKCSVQGSNLRPWPNRAILAFVFSDSNKLTLFITKVFGYRPGNNSSAFNVSTHEGAGTFQALANKELTSPKANWASRL
ncbi:hypothetical protein H8356DRAFT_1438376 [Neocallimastix lanati (nom. inval.)]|nr:hypothetical protein H8356DRAFT_1438376 [Neocallimastix sp. JGI-2020a]